MRVKTDMKNLIVIFTLVSLLGCQYRDASTPNALRTDFSEPKGNTITVGVPAFQVFIVSISDSRCPVDIECVWAGQASVAFRVVTGDFSLKIGESKTFSVGQKNYELTLADVTPFPTSANANEEKKAVFTLKQI